MSTIHHMAGKLSADKHVILIHGIDGNYKKTWIKKDNKVHFWPEWLKEDDNLQFWPRWLTEDNENICIWSVEYEAKTLYIRNDSMAFKNRAENILENIFSISEIANKEIMLIGHSMGGLIIKQMIRLSEDQIHREETKSFLSNITGIAFLGTPHAGSDLSSTGNKLLTKIILKVFLRNPSVLTFTLMRNNADLRELNQWYRRWDNKNLLTRLILGESIKTPVWGMIVKPDSSDPGLTATMILVDKNHGGLSKPESKNDEVYRHINKFVSESKKDVQNYWITVNMGNFTNGWQGYKNWAGQGKELKYIVDDKIKFTSVGDNSEDQMKAIDMLNLVRERLSHPGNSVRLVGLSGVGKTRFAQALFDASIGNNPLPKEHVFYTDTALVPNPLPDALLDKMISTDKKALIIVDNCATEMHNSLTKNLNNNPGNVSLLTIEYDIREDAHENTNIVRMESNSKELITLLLSKYHPELSYNSAHKIADVSDGNARVALALASSIGQHDDISRLRDEELFSRLFNQRKESNLELEKAAEVLSLVYSFEFESEEEYSPELICLSQLSNLPPHDLYSSAKELERRGLAQTRDVWMAILPHPVSNRLANLCLQNIPLRKIINFFKPLNDSRLFISFTRRLGNLSDSKQAKLLAQHLLSEGGVLEELLHTKKKSSSYRDISPFTVISNIAPLAPAETLNLISYLAKKDTSHTFLTRSNPDFIQISRLLRHLAYDSNLFYQSAGLLYNFTESEKPDEKNNSVQDILVSLFRPQLSGTHAPLELRISFIRDTMLQGRKDIVFNALGSLIRLSNFSSSFVSDFGSVIRDNGLRPHGLLGYELWTLTCLKFIREILEIKPTYVTDINDLLTSNFRGLWGTKIISVQDEVIDLLKSLVPSVGSANLWTAITSTLKFDSDRMTDEEKEKLHCLENYSRADTINQKLDLLIFSRQHGFYGFEQTDESGKVIRNGFDVADEAVQELAVSIAQSQPETLKEVIKKTLYLNKPNARVNMFARRLSLEVPDPKDFFEMITDIIKTNESDNISSQFLTGALNGLSSKDHVLANALLDSYMDLNQLGKIIPELLLSVPLDTNGFERMKSHLKKQNIDISGYFGLAMGRRHKNLSDVDLCDLMNSLLKHKGGLPIVLDVLHMRVQKFGNENYTLGIEILDYLRTLIIEILSHGIILFNDNMEYQFKGIANESFSNASRDELTTLINSIYLSAIKNGFTSYPFEFLLGIIIKKDITILLDSISHEIGVVKEHNLEILSFIYYHKPLALDDSQQDLLNEWCKEDRNQRYMCILKLITPYVIKDGVYTWHQFAMQIIMECSDVDTVLKEMIEQLWPRMWEGSQVDEMLRRRTLLEELLASSRSEVSTAIKPLLATFDADIANTKEREFNRERRSRSFE